MKEKVKNSTLSIFHIVDTHCEYSTDIMNQGCEKDSVRGPFIVSLLFNNCEFSLHQLDVISMLFVEVLYCFGFSFSFAVCVYTALTLCQVLFSLIFQISVYLSKFILPTHFANEVEELRKLSKVTHLEKVKLRVKPTN